MRLLFLYLFFSSTLFAQVELGIDRFFKEGHALSIAGKTLGIVTNHTGVDRSRTSTYDRFMEKGFHVAAIFSGEHGLTGISHAEQKIDHSTYKKIPVFSLHGDTRRPTDAMLKGIQVLIYDMQDVGVRSYTYISTLFYIMEEAAKRNIEVIVLDRPNPMGGIIVDGPMLHDTWRSFIGYINVPYCHGMTVGELAQFFNHEYNIQCSLKVIPMKGWNREMLYSQTGLEWVPTSPQIPEPDTPLYYASTGILGQLSLVNIGVGYTLPFKIVGAPWINADFFAEKLNAQKLPGVYFRPFYFIPFFGLYKGEHCQGVKIEIATPEIYCPLKTQYTILGLLKSLYPEAMAKKLKALPPQNRDLFCKANGNQEIWDMLVSGAYITWKLIAFESKERAAFLKKRKEYLLYP